MLFRSTPPYDPLRDFAAVAHAGAQDYVFAVGAAVPAKDLREFAAWARANPAQANFGAGQGGSTHLIGIMIGEAIGALATAPLQSWDALICPSHAIKSAVEAILDEWRYYLAERAGIERGRASPSPLQLPVIPLGVDTIRFDKITTADKRSTQRQALTLGGDATAILYVGRLNYRAKANRLPLLMAVEDVARRRNPAPVVLLFNGYFNDAENEAAFKEASAAICKFAEVRIVRHCETQFPDGLWAAADVFCSPVDNIQESFGLSQIGRAHV